MLSPRSVSQGWSCVRDAPLCHLSPHQRARGWVGTSEHSHGQQLEQSKFSFMGSHPGPSSSPQSR